MRLSSPRLRRLESTLANIAIDHDEAMLLSELDGYLVGVIVCPERLGLMEWLPAVWGGGGTPFDEELDTEWFIEQIRQHHDRIVQALGKGFGHYTPVFDVDPRHDEILWELWIYGFASAMAIRPDAWTRIVVNGDDLEKEALAGMTTLIAIDQDESDLERDLIDQLTEEAPELIPSWIDILYDWRLQHTGAPLIYTEPAVAKVGRNDPCPCGSGKKYKKCCGLT